MNCIAIIAKYGLFVFIYAFSNLHEAHELRTSITAALLKEEKKKKKKMIE